MRQVIIFLLAVGFFPGARAQQPLKMWYQALAATVRSIAGTTAKIRYGDKVMDVQLKPGQAETLGPM